MRRGESMVWSEFKQPDLQPNQSLGHHVVFMTGVVFSENLANWHLVHVGEWILENI